MFQAVLCLIATLVSGCKGHYSIAAPVAPTLPPSIDTSKWMDVTTAYSSSDYKEDLTNYKTAIGTSLTDPAQLAKAKEARNDIIWGEMGAIERVYGEYHTRLFSDKNQIAVASDGLTLGLTAASSIATHAPTKTL